MIQKVYLGLDKLSQSTHEFDYKKSTALCLVVSSYLKRNLLYFNFIINFPILIFNQQDTITIAF